MKGRYNGVLREGDLTTAGKGINRDGFAGKSVPETLSNQRGRKAAKTKWGRR